MLTKGPNNGKVALIVEVIDHNRVLIDAGTPELSRQVISIRHIELTDIKVDISKNADGETVKKCMKENDIEAKWNETPKAMMIKQEQIRKNLNDFERFQVLTLQKKKDGLLNKESVKTLSS